MQMIDVLKKLREIENPSEDVKAAIESTQKLATTQQVDEAVSVNLNGADAVLGQILKLAGMLGAQTNIDLASGPTVVGGPAGMGAPGGMSAPGGMPPLKPNFPDHGPGPMPKLPSFDKPDMGPDMDIELPPMGPDMDLDHDMDPKLPALGPLGKDSQHMDMDDKEHKPSKMGMPKVADEGGSRPYDNSPDERIMGMKSAVPSGNDINRSKKTYPKVAGGDNPMHVAVTFD
jgi:hypothetical protein